MCTSAKKCLPFVLGCFQVLAPPRLENLDSEEKDALFGLDTQITTYFHKNQDFFLCAVTFVVVLRYNGPYHDIIIKVAVN
jgi:hypothetical protein